MKSTMSVREYGLCGVIRTVASKQVATRFVTTYNGPGTVYMADMRGSWCVIVECCADAEIAPATRTLSAMGA
jgi:hypothetical protein